MIMTIKMMPNKIIPTRDQLRELSAKIRGVPIPPAPITPKMAADRTLISNLYNVYDRKSGNTCGNTAYQSIWNRFAPVAINASVGPLSIFSIPSEYNFLTFQ